MVIIVFSLALKAYDWINTSSMNFVVVNIPRRCWQLLTLIVTNVTLEHCTLIGVSRWSVESLVWSVEEDLMTCFFNSLASNIVGTLSILFLSFHQEKGDWWFEIILGTFQWMKCNKFDVKSSLFRNMLYPGDCNELDPFFFIIRTIYYYCYQNPIQYLHFYTNQTWSGNSYFLAAAKSLGKQNKQDVI